MVLRIERLSGPDALAALAAQWDKIDSNLLPRTPFTSVEWAKLWWTHLRRDSFFTRHEFFVHLVRDEGGRAIAVVPLVITNIPSKGWPRLRILQFFGAGDSSITELRGIICEEKHAMAVIGAVKKHFQECEQKWDLVLWNGLRTQEIRQHQDELLKVAGQRPTYVVCLPQTWPELRSRLSPNMKEAIRKAYKLLERDNYTFSFHVREKPSEISAALDRFLALHAARAEAPRMSDHPNYFARTECRRFFLDLCQCMGKAGKLRVFELEVLGEIVASRIAFLQDDHLYFYYSGFDPTWRKYSVMTTLMCESMKWAIRNGVQSANLSTGKDRSKLRWKPREIVYHDAMQRSATMRGLFAFFIHSLVRKTRLGGLDPVSQASMMN
jgi:CelD/BcsL family acetyltransferase involved in cellulose biosynthesis